MDKATAQFLTNQIATLDLVATQLAGVIAELERDRGVDRVPGIMVGRILAAVASLRTELRESGVLAA